MDERHELNQMNSISSMTDLLKAAAEMKASDLHLIAGFKPALRINGEIVQMDYSVLKPDDVEKLVFSILSEEQKKSLIMIGSWIFHIQFMGLQGSGAI